MEVYPGAGLSHSVAERVEESVGCFTITPTYPETCPLIRPVVSYTTLSRRLSLCSNLFAGPTHHASPASASSGTVSTPGDIDTLPAVVAGTTSDLDQMQFDTDTVTGGTGSTEDWDTHPDGNAWLAVEHDWASQLGGSPTVTSPASILPTPNTVEPDMASPKRLCIAPRVGTSFSSGTVGHQHAGSTSSAPWLDSANFFDTPSETAFSAAGLVENTVRPASIQKQQAMPDSSKGLAGNSAVVQQQDDVVGKVSLVVENCDRDTLGHMLKMHRTLRGKGKLQIDHAE